MNPNAQKPSETYHSEPYRTLSPRTLVNPIKQILQNPSVKTLLNPTV